ncbi:Tethering factor for nuclear proteasome sts1 [Elasticomyces elasticus]
MNTIISSDQFTAPHLLSDPYRTHGMLQHALRARHQRIIVADDQQADSLPVPSMSGRKRKASEEPDQDRMSTSPTASPSFGSRLLPTGSTPRSIKRSRTGAAVGRPLALPRLLETLSAAEMRQLLQNVADQHPELQREIVTKAPRPSIESTLQVLSKYEDDFREAFPLGNRPSSDYSYNRVRQHLQQLIEALRDYTPHFLPPQESQAIVSLNYLDSVTDILHRLPNWDSYQHQRYKHEAYDEIAKAWALVIREASKRALGFHLQFGGWDQKLVDHNQKSGGRLEEAVNELRSALGFMQAAPSSASPGVSEERASIRQQLFSGSYGQQLGVGQGGW